MSLGVEVNTRLAPPARGAPTLTDTLFVLGQADQGPTDKAVEVRSIADFAAVYGPRAAENLLVYDPLDAYFREGGRRAFISRYTDVGTIDAAAALLHEGLGPGQIVAWGDETPGAGLFGDLLDTAAGRNRFALMDVANNDTVAAMQTLGNAIPASNNEYGALFGPWVNIPAPAGVVGGSARQVPASAIVAALIARADALGNPNRAPAGRDFPLQYVTSFVREITDQERITLLNEGVNTFADKFGVLQLYGFQTAVGQSADTPFWQANCGRARMWLKAHAKSAGEAYMFKPLDGQGRLQRALKTDLDAIGLALYGVDGLYGESPEEAFATEVGAAVNTETTVAQGELHGVMEARFSLHTKRVLIDLVSVPITGRVSTAA